MGPGRPPRNGGGGGARAEAEGQSPTAAGIGVWHRGCQRGQTISQAPRQLSVLLAEVAAMEDLDSSNNLRGVEIGCQH